MVDFNHAFPAKWVEDAKKYMEDRLRENISPEESKRFWYGELERLKYEFKKFLVQSVINGKRNIFWVD